MTKCTIILKDEVNCKVEGLDLDTRKKLVNKLSYFLPHAYHTPAYKLGRWDGKVNFFTVGGVTYTNLLDEIIPIIVADGYEIDIEDHRTHHNLEFVEVTDQTFAHKTWPKGHPVEGQPVVLRDYQIEIINKFLETPMALQEVATGAGKTLITAGLSATVEPYGRSIIIVPNKDLVKQTYADYVNLGLDVGVYFGDKKELGKTHTICTWQSLNSIKKKFREAESELSLQDFAEDVVCVIVDECFSPDSKVLTPTGYIPIKDIKVGDAVINYSESNGEYKEDTVLDTFVNMEKSSDEDMLELEFDNGKIIQVTANHKFLTENHGWVRADELTPEMNVKSINTSN